jgi:uncharacterized protein (DUF2147 family)
MQFFPPSQKTSLLNQKEQTQKTRKKTQMKLNKITAAAMALALAAALATAAQAAAPTWSDGDVFVGFENGGTNNYVVDLGPASQFTSASTTLTFKLHDRVWRHYQFGAMGRYR